MVRYYKVAEQIFGIEAAERYFELLDNYAPFEVAAAEAVRFTIAVEEGPISSAEGWQNVYTDTCDEDMPRIELYQRPEEWLFRVSTTKEGKIVSAMRCSLNWRDVHVSLLPGYERFAIDNAAMLVFAFATLENKTLLFHSSVIVRDGVGYLFLGHSGTGKSTHSRQWLAAFDDAVLLNDDNPAVRICEDGKVRVYGSPWSGKTPCYRKEEAPVAALVQLAQAPHNEMKKLKMTQAYPYVLASVSGLKVLPEMMDQIYESIARLLELSPVYLLECLPNLEAAQLCAQTCSPSPCRTDKTL